MSRIKEAFDDQIAINAMFAHDSTISENEAFEILFNDDVPVENLPAAYQNLYTRWQYLNIK